MLTKIKERVVDAVPDARQQKRRAVRLELAECQLNQQRQAEVRALIAASDRRVNEAVAIHAQKCQPIQSRLSDLEAEMLSCIADRKDVASKVGSERARLLSDLDSANRELELITSSEKEVRKKLLEQLTQMQVGSTPRDVLENKLAGIELARPEWFDRHFALSHLLEFIKLSSRDADDKIARQREFAADSMDETAGSKHDKDYSDVYGRRIQTWKAVASIGSDFVLQITREMADLRKRMIDE